jgi:hypothetical protein
MTGRELAEMFMFHQMQKAPNECMTIDQAERMIMAFAHDYHESEVKKLNLHVVSKSVCDKCNDFGYTVIPTSEGVITKKCDCQKQTVL